MNYTVSGLELGLGAVLVGVTVLILAQLILSVELGAGEGWLRHSNGLAGKIGLGNNRLVDYVSLGLADNILLLNCWLDCDIGLLLNNGLHLLLDNIRLLNCNWLVDEVRLILILLDDWLSFVGLGFNNLLDNFLLWLAGNCVRDNLQVLFSCSDHFGSVLNWNGEGSFSSESERVGDVVNSLDLAVSINVVVGAGDDTVSSL